MLKLKSNSRSANQTNKKPSVKIQTWQVTKSAETAFFSFIDNKMDQREVTQLQQGILTEKIKQNHRLGAQRTCGAKSEILTCSVAQAKRKREGVNRWDGRMYGGCEDWGRPRNTFFSNWSRFTFSVCAIAFSPKRRIWRCSMLYACKGEETGDVKETYSITVLKNRRQLTYVLFENYTFQNITPCD